jgi:hypothetical protein
MIKAVSNMIGKDVWSINLNDVKANGLIVEVDIGSDGIYQDIYRKEEDGENITNILGEPYVDYDLSPSIERGDLFSENILSGADYISGNDLINFIMQHDPNTYLKLKNIKKKANKKDWYKVSYSNFERVITAQSEKINVQIPSYYKDTIDEFAEKAKQIGLKAYAVGGFVRDLILGKNPKDLDIMVDVVDRETYHRNIKPIYEEAIKNPIQYIQSQISGAKKITDVNKFRIEQSNHRPEFFRIICEIDYTDNSTKTPKEVKGEYFETSINPSQLFAKQFNKTIPAGEAFGIYVIVMPIGNIEVAYPRTETYDKDSRKPRTEMGTIAEDATRRDFSMNSLFLDIDNFELIDGSGHGLEDIKNKRIRMTDPENMASILKEDPLRILRSLRFAAQLGFEIDPEILEYIKMVMELECPIINNDNRNRHMATLIVIST